MNGYFTFQIHSTRSLIKTLSAISDQGEHPDLGIENLQRFKKINDMHPNKVKSRFLQSIVKKKSSKQWANFRK